MSGGIGRKKDGDVDIPDFSYDKTLRPVFVGIAVARDDE